MSKAEWFSILASTGLLVWVRVATGRGAFSIILDALPDLVK